jgi:hypothetical protein
MRAFEYVCGRCGCTYRAFQVAVSYGTLGFRDESGKHIAVIDAIGDPLFRRVDAVLQRHPASGSIGELRQGQVIQRVVAHLSDPSPTGQAYDPDALPACPHCGALSPSDWKSVEPPDIAKLEIPVLSRTAWDALPEAEQEELLAQEVNDAISRSSLG